jgi:hypothetical protein
MGSISKGFSLFVIVVLAASSLIVVKPACAQVGVTNPSMPDWGVMYEAYTIYVPPTYGVDPSTGKAVITQAGYDEVYRKVWVDIQNQPFVPYNNSNGQLMQLFYDVRWKGHSDNSWEGPPDGIWTTQLSGSPATGIIIGFKGFKGSSGWMQLLDYVPGSQIDFQVKASIGYYTTNNVFVGETSGWSNTQTITIDSRVPISTPGMPSQNSTTTDQSGSIGTSQIDRFLPWIILALLTIATLAVAAVFRRKRQTKPSTKKLIFSPT